MIQQEKKDAQDIQNTDFDKVILYTISRKEINEPECLKSSLR